MRRLQEKFIGEIMMHNIIKKLLLTVALMCTILLTGCTQNNINKENTVSLETIPQFEGKAYVELNGNIPSFPEEDKTKQSFEHYEKLDVLGRARGAYANIGKETMPKEKEEAYQVCTQQDGTIPNTILLMENIYIIAAI